MKEVFTLMVELGRIAGDDFPEKSTGGAMVIFAPSTEEAIAVRETVQLLREAGLNPLEVTNYGTVNERRDEGYEFSSDEEELVEEALREDAMIIIEKQVFYDEDDDGQRH